MTLEALGRQYAAEAGTLGEIIASCDPRRRSAMRAGNGGEAKRLKRAADAHAKQQEDLMQISSYLRHYYDRPDGDEPYHDDHTSLTTMGGTWVHV